MTLFAYLDCSGDSRDPQARVITVAGYIAHEKQWALFEEQWAAALKTYGVDALHMKEYAHSVKGSAFEAWKGDTAKRNGFIGALTDVINGCQLESVSTTLSLTAYENCNADWLLREAFGAPYAVATLKTVAETVGWHSRHAADEPLLIVLEKGDNDQAAFNRTLARLGEWNLDLVTQPIIQKKHWKSADGRTQYCLPFQAADFVCYEHAKMFTDLIVKGKRNVRESIFRVSYPARGDVQMAQFLGEKWIRGFARHFKVLPRCNRASDGVSAMPNEPLCYLDMDQPLVAYINPTSWSKQALRVAVEVIARVPTRE